MRTRPTTSDGQRPTLTVLVDGVPLPEDAARALWQRFSDWMEEHRGDLAGFAAREGFTSVHPGVDKGEPVLLASQTAPQRPYAPIQEARVGQGTGGSRNRHDRGRTHRSGPRKPQK
jgi:hypothetical protein